MPRCGQAKLQTAQIPGNEPFGVCPQLLGERKFPLPGSGLHSRITKSVLPSPSTLYVFQYCVWCVAFAVKISISIRVRHSSFSRGHPSGNARGANTSCLPQPRRVRRGYPTRACTRDSLPQIKTPIYFLKQRHAKYYLLILRERYLYLFSEEDFLHKKR